MKERPILFSAPMVRALLAGTKTQTRRIVKSPNVDGAEVWAFDGGRGLWESGMYGEGGVKAHGEYVRCPYGVLGDRLWVRETHAQFMVGEGLDRPVPQCVAYRATCNADGSFDYVNGRGEIMGLKITKWTPAIHMPRWASRIDLDVADVRVERLQAISEEDARAEGVAPAPFCKAGRPDGMEHVEAFENLWREINGAKSWDANPWVWVVSFKRARP